MIALCLRFVVVIVQCLETKSHCLYSNEDKDLATRGYSEVLQARHLGHSGLKGSLVDLCQIRIRLSDIT